LAVSLARAMAFSHSPYNVGMYLLRITCQTAAEAGFCWIWTIAVLTSSTIP
jgi:hypothetical protein